jgi:pimeloyl-ACP methyl ester carboxylesterase
MKYARNGHVELYHETFGDPDDAALLLVNGLGSQCVNFRVEWCEQFAAEGFHVIRFDNRDVGLSTKLTALYSLDDMAADAIAVLDAVGVDRAHVMGVSMGGMIVQALAITYPARLLSMTSVMSNTGEPGFGHGSAEARASLGAPPPRERAANIEYFLERQRVIGSPGCFDQERLRTIAGELYDRCFYPEGVAHQMMAITTAPSRDDALRTITVPALVLHGDRDPLVDISGGIHTAEVIPGATFVVMEGMGHDYPPQYWDRWVQLVTDHARAAAATT